MEKVQFQLEATLPELRDLHEKGLFTKHEIDQITRRRTNYETSLIRQKTRKDDFFKYAEYEINLERLRKVRWKRMGYHINPPPPSASTHSLTRRASYILKRATAKFPGDLAVWLAYVEFASREGMRKVVIKGLTSALQHHPLSPTLYLLLSYHHLHPASPFPRDMLPQTATSSTRAEREQHDSSFSLEGTSAARTQLLLGLRMIPDSTELWTEYIKLELGWVEALRRRWNVLGIYDELDVQENDGVEAERLTGGEGSFGPDGEDARKAILAGKLVLQAISSALEAISVLERGLEFRLSLVDMLRRYPSALRGKCLDAVFEDLQRVEEEVDLDARVRAEARLAIATRRLYETKYTPGEDYNPLQGVELVEELGRVGKEIRKSAKGDAAFCDVGGKWLADQVQLHQDKGDLRTYLLSILSSLTTAKHSPSASLLLLHLRLVERYGTNEEYTAAARSHAARHPSSAALQRARLDQDIAAGSSDLTASFETAVKGVSPVEAGNEEEDIRGIWFTWTAYEESHAESPAQLDAAWAKILTLSSRLNRPPTHTALLGRYLISTLQRPSPLPALRTLDSFAKYRPTEDVYAIAFAAISVYSSQPYADLTSLYQRWQGAARDSTGRTTAALTWAKWLLSQRKGAEATRIVDSVRREDPAEVEREWKQICDEAEEQSGLLSRASGADDKEIRLARELRRIGWAGLGNPDGHDEGVVDSDDESEGGDEDEDDVDMDSADEDEDGTSQESDEEMVINV